MAVMVAIIANSLLLLGRSRLPYEQAKGTDEKEQGSGQYEPVRKLHRRLSIGWGPPQ